MSERSAVVELPVKWATGLRPGVPLRLSELTWMEYLSQLEVIGDRPLVTSYSDGEMEILMPSGEHEVWVILLGRLIEVLAAEISMSIKCYGTSTFRREDLEKGLEPDRCYYLTNVPKVRGKLRLDLRFDPPPDLACEIEVTRSAERRMPIYAALGVPEVWRFNGEKIAVHRLMPGGEYVVAQESGFFPILAVNEMPRFMKMQDRLDDRELSEEYRLWVRSHVIGNRPSA